MSLMVSPEVMFGRLRVVGEADDEGSFAYSQSSANDDSEWSNYDDTDLDYSDSDGAGATPRHDNSRISEINATMYRSKRRGSSRTPSPNSAVLSHHRNGSGGSISSRGHSPGPLAHKLHSPPSSPRTSSASSSQRRKRIAAGDGTHSRDSASGSHDHAGEQGRDNIDGTHTRRSASNTSGASSSVSLSMGLLSLNTSDVAAARKHKKARPPDLKLGRLVPPDGAAFTSALLGESQNGSPGSPLSRTAQQAAWRMWEECASEDGHRFYYNRSTGESQWERPFSTPPPRRTEGGMWQSVSDQNRSKSKNKSKHKHQHNGLLANPARVGGEECLLNRPIARVEKEVAAMTTSAARGAGRKSTPVKVSPVGKSRKSERAVASMASSAATPSAPFELNHAAPQNQNQNLTSYPLDTSSKPETAAAAPLAPRVDTALHAAVSYGYVSDEHVASLLRAGGPQADPNAPDVYGGRTPFHISASGAYFAGMEMLLNAGADPAAKDDSGHTAMHHACMGGCGKYAVDVVMYLHQSGLAIGPRNHVGDTPLHLSSAMGDTACVEYLLQVGAEPEGPPNARGETPAHLAAGMGHMRVVELVTDYGARIDLQDNEHRTPHAVAIAAGKIWCAERIAELPTNPTSRRARAASVAGSAASSENVAPSVRSFSSRAPSLSKRSSGSGTVSAGDNGDVSHLISSDSEVGSDVDSLAYAAATPRQSPDASPMRGNNNLNTTGNNDNNNNNNNNNNKTIEGGLVFRQSAPLSSPTSIAIQESLRGSLRTAQADVDSERRNVAHASHALAVMEDRFQLLEKEHSALLTQVANMGTQAAQAAEESNNQKTLAAAARAAKRAAEKSAQEARDQAVRTSAELRRHEDALASQTEKLQDAQTMLINV